MLSYLGIICLILRSFQEMLLLGTVVAVRDAVRDFSVASRVGAPKQPPQHCKRSHDGKNSDEEPGTYRHYYWAGNFLGKKTLSSATVLVRNYRRRYRLPRIANATERRHCQKEETLYPQHQTNNNPVEFLLFYDVPVMRQFMFGQTSSMPCARAGGF